jgi:hypothetical protein
LLTNCVESFLLREPHTLSGLVHEIAVGMVLHSKAAAEKLEVLAVQMVLRFFDVTLVPQ